jgi:hypothetical protein
VARITIPLHRNNEVWSVGVKGYLCPVSGNVMRLIFKVEAFLISMSGAYVLKYFY